MSLFESVAKRVISAGLMGRNIQGSIQSELKSAARTMANKQLNNMFGSGNILGSLSRTVLNHVVNDYRSITSIGDKITRDLGSSIAREINRNGFSSIQSNLGLGSNVGSNSSQNRDLGSHFLSNKGMGSSVLSLPSSEALTSGGIGGGGSSSLSGGGDNPVLSGVSLERAVQIFREHADMKLVKKNLFLLEISSQLTGGESHTLHMLATAIDYPTMTVTSEKARIGTANADLVSSNDAIDITITTYDNKAGELKEWFKKHQLANTPLDGTAGVPSQYAIKIKIVHGVIDEGQHGYEDKGYFRAQSMTHSLSRHEHEIHEVSMQFTQLDTFYGW